MKRLLIFGAVVALMLSLVSVQQPSRAQESTNEFLITGSECIQRDASGQQRWVGEPSSGLREVADKLQELIETDPGDATGQAYCSAYDGIMITVSSAAPQELFGAIDAVQRAHPTETIHVVEVVASLSELLDVVARITSETSMPQGIVSIGPDVTTGGLEVGYDPTKWPSAETLAAQLAEHTVTADGTPLPLRFTEEEGVSENSTRIVDSPPYYMGDLSGVRAWAPDAHIG